MVLIDFLNKTIPGGGKKQPGGGKNFFFALRSKSRPPPWLKSCVRAWSYPPFFEKFDLHFVDQKAPWRNPNFSECRLCCCLPDICCRWGFECRFFINSCPPSWHHPWGWFSYSPFTSCPAITHQLHWLFLEGSMSMLIIRKTLMSWRRKRRLVLFQLGKDTLIFSPWWTEPPDGRRQFS